MLNIENKIKEQITEEAQDFVDDHLLSLVTYYHESEGHVYFDDCVDQVKRDISPDCGFYTYYSDQYELIEKKLGLTCKEFYELVSFIVTQDTEFTQLEKKELKDENDFRNEGIGLYTFLVAEEFYRLAYDQEDDLTPEEE